MLIFRIIMSESVRNYVSQIDWLSSNADKPTDYVGK